MKKNPVSSDPVNMSTKSLLYSDHMTWPTAFTVLTMF